MQEQSNVLLDGQPQPPPSSPTHHDIQRGTLRNLVDLATECAVSETQIEQQHQKAEDDAKKDAERTNWAIEERNKSAKDAAEKKDLDRIEQIETEFKSASMALAASLKAARQRIQIDSRSTERDIKKEFDQAVWESEALFDGTQAQLRDDAKKAREHLAGQLQTVAEKQRQTGAMMELYGMTVVPKRQATPEGQQSVGDASAAFEAACNSISHGLIGLAALRLPRLFVGARPHFLALFLVATAVFATQVLVSRTDLQVVPMAIAGASTLVVVLVLGAVLRVMARKQVAEVYGPLGQSLDAAKAAAEAHAENARIAREQDYNQAAERCQNEKQTAKLKFDPLLQAAAAKRDALLLSCQTDYSHKLAAIQSQHEQARADAEQRRQQTLTGILHRYERELQAAKGKADAEVAENDREYAEARVALERRLADGLIRIQEPMKAAMSQQSQDWDEATWKEWSPPTTFPSLVRFGQLQIDLKKIAAAVPRQGDLRLDLPEAFSVPTSLAFPRQASLLIQADRDGRVQGLRTLQMVMARLLTGLPPGRVRFTLIDPVGLGQNFAGFMHLADHDEALVGTRIWTESEHIDQRLADLTQHMETVIQKYLRNEFQTIDDYNAQAGELAEPYRYLVIADFPQSFTPEALKRLSSIASSGARCGVYTLILRDQRQPMPGGIHMDEIESHSVNLVWDNGRFIWKDQVFEQLPLTLDPPPAEDFLTRILEVVGKRAKDAKRVEVSFELITPPNQQLWTQDSSEELTVPIGRLGATRFQALRLGRGVAQHTLIAGKTGSGKSNLFHVLITNLAMWYSPDQVEFYLVDFKKGVEFKTYATHVLPHARAIAVESDREFGLSVLQRVDAELSRRGELFRKLGTQELAAYRQASGKPLPRTLLIIDEFQEFFSEDDKLSQDAGLLLDRLVRQGRAFGIHVLLGSQTIGGTSGLARSTLGQMAVRIALQCSDADSQLILGDSNSAARLLSRPGEAIYNDAGGLVEGNSPFQIAWLPDPVRDRVLKKVIEQKPQRTDHHAEPIVFEGNSAADLAKNKRLAALLDTQTRPAATAAALAWMGDPVAIKDPTAVPFRRQSGSNLLIIGQQEESAMAILSAAMISLAACQSPQAAQFYVLDGCPADSPLAGVLPRVAAALPHNAKLVAYREIPQLMADLSDEWQRRLADQQPGTPSIYVLIYGLQRYRMLRKQEESFSFSATDEEKKPQPDKLFAELLREGPAAGIHTLAWADTPATIERMLERTAVREFDYRVLFQMSANDSSNLIDSPIANKLGFHRAICYSEEQGVMEKFRPYALPDSAWLEQIKTRLASR